MVAHLDRGYGLYYCKGKVLLSYAMDFDIHSFTTVINLNIDIRFLRILNL